MYYIEVFLAHYRGIYEPCHGKTDLMVFVVVIPKEELVGGDPANPSFGMTPTIDL